MSATPSNRTSVSIDPQVRSFRGAYQTLLRPFTVQSPSAEIAQAVDFVYGEMKCDTAGAQGLEIDIHTVDAASSKLRVLFGGEPVFEVEGLGDLLHQLDNELTIALEHALPSLYFVHAAALADNGRATLLVGDSGAGKSTTTFALAASGMAYFSDELAPIEPAAGVVLPYPRAMCLKRDPPAPLSLPAEHLRTEWTLHVRARDLQSRVVKESLPLGRVIFVRYSPEHARARLKPISRGEAAIRFYRGALNQLAHPAFGLDDTVSLIRRAECFELQAAGIEETVRVVRGES